MPTDTKTRTEQIATLNDAFRTRFAGGTIAVTTGVRALSADVIARLFHAVQTFDKFDADCPERDFGMVNVANQKFFFKVDYYDANSLDTGSDDPADPAKTHRVMTIMCADEY